MDAMEIYQKAETALHIVSFLAVLIGLRWLSQSSPEPELVKYEVKFDALKFNGKKSTGNKYQAEVEVLGNFSTKETRQKLKELLCKRLGFKEITRITVKRMKS